MTRYFQRKKTTIKDSLILIKSNGGQNKRISLKPSGKMLNTKLYTKLVISLKNYYIFRKTKDDGIHVHQNFTIRNLTAIYQAKIK